MIIKRWRGAGPTELGGPVGQGGQGGPGGPGGQGGQGGLVAKKILRKLKDPQDFGNLPLALRMEGLMVASRV